MAQQTTNNDIRFLCQLHKGLTTQTFTRIVDDSQSRACVAVVLRVRPKDYSRDKSYSLLQQSVATFEEFIKHDWVRDGSVQILYIKRAVNESDRWSGDVAFPGGRRQKSDRDDQATAERETFEELGLQLSNRLQFMCLGHIDDLQILPGRNVKKMVLSCYVYLQLTAHTPAFHLQRTEIAAHRWVRADALYSSPRIVSLRFSLSSFNPSIRAPQALLSSLGLDPVHLPAVLLPPADLDVGRPANLDVGQPADPNVGDEEDLSQEFCLWGLTLGRTSELLSIASKPRLDRPPISTNNVFANHVIRSRFGNRSPHGISLPLFSYQLSLATALLLGAYFELRARM